MIKYRSFMWSMIQFPPQPLKANILLVCLSGVAGRIPRLAAHDMVHNRTINLKGGPESNMSWDRAVKFLNHERTCKYCMQSWYSSHSTLDLMDLETMDFRFNGLDLNADNLL